MAIAAFVSDSCVVTFASSSRMHYSKDESCDQTPKLESNMSKEHFSSVVRVAICIMIESVVYAPLVNYNMMARTILLK